MDAHLSFTGFMDRRIHLAVTGSVAAYKALELVRMWTGSGASVSATLTKAAEKFVSGLSFSALGADPVYGGMFDADSHVFAHLEPGQAAQVMVVAPATANALAKLSCGLADDLFSCQALAFDGPIVVAPAMNPRLWNAPATQENWQRLKDRGLVLVEPGIGDMACGEKGRGRFPELETIYLEALRAATPQDLAGRRIMIGLGPTREHFDCVRFWSNPSSGIMGGALAVSAWLRGAEVTAVCGPVSLWLPKGIKRVDVTTAREMFEACTGLWPDFDMACMCAAVADFSPKPFGSGKFKKEGARDGMTLEFTPNPDILNSMAAGRRVGQILVGFAAESQDIEKLARKKLDAKSLDLIVANDVTKDGSGFGTSTNAVVVADRNGRVESWPKQDKTEVAWRVWDWTLQF